MSGIPEVPKQTPFSAVDIEFGRALCDRLGLPHDSTVREWKAETVGDSIMVSMTTVKMLTVEEYAELHDVAVKRAGEKT